MSIAIIDKTWQPNPVVDMIRACVDHYHKYEKWIDTVYLEPIRWGIFKTWLQKNYEEIADEILDEVHFRDIKVKKASFSMVEPLTVTFKPQIPH